MLFNLIYHKYYFNFGQNFLFEKINYIKMSYIYQNNGLTSSLNETPSETAAFSQGFQDENNNLNNIPHKGIFHPEPNILICRANCFYKYLGFYLILFGLFFVCLFIPLGIHSKVYDLALIGSIFFQYH